MTIGLGRHSERNFCAAEQHYDLIYDNDLDHYDQVIGPSVSKALL